MNAAPSLTAADSFRLRIQRSEQSRALFMAAIYTVLLLVYLGRRATGGAVMTSVPLFVTAIAACAAGIAYQAFVFMNLRAANRRARLVERWRLDATLAVELAVPSLILIAAHFWSPRTEYAALSGPSLLLFPLTILLSVLRLRPRATLVLGLACALVHLGLVLNTLRAMGLDPSQAPVLLSYPLLLALTGIGGMLVTGAARRYVAEAATEAIQHERTSAQLAHRDRDLEVARSIQRGLLPEKPPDFPGFGFAGLNIPAEKTGGDYYDWQVLPDGRLLVVMADVTGHGVGPAIVMAICRAYARASAPLTPDLNSLLGRLNTLLAADLRGARFITLAVALLDPGGRAQLLSAGHGPTLLYRARDKAVELFGGDGLPLAVVPDESYGPIRDLDIEPGDTLVMLTDGVFEWLNADNQQFGTARLARALSRCAHKAPAEILSDLHQAVRDFAGAAPQTDDLTIVVMKRRG